MLKTSFMSKGVSHHSNHDQLFWEPGDMIDDAVLRLDTSVPSLDFVIAFLLQWACILVKGTEK